MNRDFVKQSVAILATDGFEEIELTAPAQALAHAGVETVIVSPTVKKIQACNGNQLSDWYDVNQKLGSARIQAFDALLIPGGPQNIAALGEEKAVLNFVRKFVATGKPVFSVGYGPQLLIKAKVVNGRAMTAHKSVQKDLADAGAFVSDFMLVTDGSLVTCRSSEQLLRFNQHVVDLTLAQAQAPLLVAA